MQAMLEEKEIWDVVDSSCYTPTITTQTKKKTKQHNYFQNYQAKSQYAFLDQYY